MKKLFLVLASVMLSASAFATSFKCDVWQGGFDPSNEISISGDTVTGVNQQWNNSLGQYTISISKTLSAGDHPAYPFGLLEITFNKMISGSSAAIYTAQLYPLGKTEGSFFTEGLEHNNYVQYRCLIQ